MSVPRLFPDFDGDAYETHPGEAACRGPRLHRRRDRARHDPPRPPDIATRSREFSLRYAHKGYIAHRHHLDTNGFFTSRLRVCDKARTVIVVVLAVA